MKKDNILKPVGLLFVITVIVAIVNFIYNIVMSRMLSVVDFGDLRAIFSVAMILTVPLGAIQTMMAKFTAEYYKTNLGKLKSVTMHFLTFLVFLGMIFIVIFTGFRRPIANYLKVSSSTSIVLLGIWMFLALIQPVILGLYRGMQRFFLLGLNTLVNVALKLVLGIGFVYLGFATLGALFGVALSAILVILVFGTALFFLFRKHKMPKESYNRGQIYSYSGYALGVLICFSIISQIDILIVKHKFLPTEAGFYACAAVIGKAFLFLPIPIVTVLFPKVVENNKLGRSSLPILIQSLLICLLVCVFGVVVCFFFPDYLIRIFGSKYSQAVHLIKIFAIAMSPFALFYILMNYFISEYRLNFFYYCLGVCILTTTVLFLVPRTLNQFISVLGTIGLLIFILPLAYILIKEKKVV